MEIPFDNPSFASCLNAVFYGRSKQESRTLTENHILALEFEAGLPVQPLLYVMSLVCRRPQLIVMMC